MLRMELQARGLWVEFLRERNAYSKEKGGMQTAKSAAWDVVGIRYIDQLEKLGCDVVEMRADIDRALKKAAKKAQVEPPEKGQYGGLEPSQFVNDRLGADDLTTLEILTWVIEHYDDSRESGDRAPNKLAAALLLRVKRSPGLYDQVFTWWKDLRKTLVDDAKRKKGMEEACVVLAEDIGRMLQAVGSKVAMVLLEAQDGRSVERFRSVGAGGESAVAAGGVPAGGEGSGVCGGDPGSVPAGCGVLGEGVLLDDRSAEG